ncbi:MAG: hypothetical protein EAZ99_03600 [Alphaproteobacteria bacterium]|nr:hypothetical protein [Alphaproteobacteria bacterium]TAD91189.1 MAG: hypothetical protein EAZ99_03600 [Alphaproteobacteria bacterium]
MAEAPSSALQFAETDYLIRRGMLPPDLARFVAAQLRLQRTTTPRAKGDSQVEQSFAVYGPLPSETLLEWCRPQMEAETGLRLYPTYSYARIYDTGAELAPHIDRGHCEISATVCLDYRGPANWPIFLENRRGEAIEVMLAPGDVLIYRGMVRKHWRLAYTGFWHAQCFLHYVDADGPLAENRYGRRQGIGFPPVD